MKNQIEQKLHDSCEKSHHRKEYYYLENLTAKEYSLRSLAFVWVA